MSLVNDMLRDLEQRNERPAEVPGNQPAVKAAQHVEPDEPNRAPRIALWSIGIVAIGATLWLLAEEYWPTSAQPVVTVAEDKREVRVEPKALQEQSAQLEASKARVEPVQSNTSVDSVATTLETTIAPVLDSKPTIEQIKWAGADFGGDLVVRLKGDADIQVVNQQENVIAIAFEDVELNTTLPVIASPLISELDVYSEDDRTLLTLTTQLQSQFAFRIQQNPTTVVIGVIPEEPVFASDSSADEESRVVQKQEEVAQVRDEPETPQSQPPVTKTPLKSGEQLQVHVTPPQRDNTAISKPVSKAKALPTDKQIVSRAQQLINKGDLNKAEALLREAIQKRPEKASASRGLLATLLLSTGSITEAQSVIGQGLDRHPNDGTLKKLQARIWLSSGQYQQAINLLKQQPPAMANDPEYHELLATAYQQRAQPEAAARIYYQLLQQNNQVPRWWIGMGYSMEQAKRYADARNAYQSGLQIPSIAPRLKSYARQRLQALAGQ